MRYALFFIPWLLAAQLPKYPLPVGASTGGNVGGASSLITVGAIPRVSAAGTLGESFASITASPVTMTLYDSTAGTGSTTLTVRAGPGQGSTNLQEWKDAAGSITANVNSSGAILADSGFYVAGGGNWSSASTAIRHRSDSLLMFASGTNATGTIDTAFGRTSAGKLQINSSTAGNWGVLDTGGISMKSLATPGAVTVTPTCATGCTATWTYTVEALLADGTLTTVPGAAGSTALQNATLDASNLNTLSCSAVTGATSYRFRRTVSGGTPATLGVIGTASTCALVDNGLAGDGSSAPTVNSTGSLLWATDGGGNIGASGANRPGNIYTAGSILSGGDVMAAIGSYFYWNGRSAIHSPADTYITLSNSAVTDFSCLQLGGTTATFPGLCRKGNAIAIRQANDTVGTVAGLTACAAGLEGALAPVSDSNTATWGATIAGGGANRVLGYCNGTNWTVAAK